MKTTEQENTGRNPDGTFAPGFSGNPGGRPRNSLKDYIKDKLSGMTPEEKEEWLKGIPKELQWQMGEGRPAQNTDVTSKGEKIQSIFVEKETISDLSSNNSDQETS